MKLQRGVRLSQYSNYKIGGPAAFFVRAKNVAEIKEAIAEARERQLPLFILGGGTNLLIPDEGFKGLVLQPDIRTLARKGNEVRVGAGVAVKDFLNFTAREGLSGFEWAGGLPGMMGGAIRGNAGAFGGETKDTVVNVTSIDVVTGKILKRTKRACRFGYRMSVYKEKEGREVIVEAVFRLKKGDPKAIRKAIREKIGHRLARHPMEYPNIGSIFKNVPLGEIPKSRKEELAYNPKMDPFPVVPTARLISKAGLKGAKRGGVMISEKHSNFIVNLGRGTERDVAWLMDRVKKTIKKKFGIALEAEVEILREKLKKLPRLS